MCNFGNNGFCGGNLCWIIILLILFCGCGNMGGYGTAVNNGGCGNNCGNGCGCGHDCCC